MNNTILIIGFTLIELSILCIGLGFYILIKAKLKIYESENSASKFIGEQYTKLISLHNDMYDQYRKIYDSYGLIRKQYQEVINCDHKIDEDFLKLLEAWNAVEGHYSDAYEQFKEYNERLKTLEQKIDKITPPEFDLRIDPPLITDVIVKPDEPLL